MTTQITQFPPAPQHTDPPAVFSTKGDNFIAAFPQFVIEVNSLSVELMDAVNNASLGTISTSTTSLTISTIVQTLTVGMGLGYATGQVVKITRTANVADYMIGYVTTYNTSTGQLQVDVYQVGGNVGSSFSAWTITGSALFNNTLRRTYRTSNTALTVYDANKVFELSGSFTQTFSSATLLGNGWYVYLMNVGVQDITLDPSGSETIDSVTTLTLKAGTSLIVYSDGAGLRTIILRDSNQPTKGYKNLALITSTQSWVKPLGVSRVRIYAVGAGAAGHITNGSGGGGGLAFGDVELTGVTGVSVSITGSTTSVSMSGAGNILIANAASGITAGTASLAGTYVFNGGAYSGGAGGGRGGGSSGTVFGAGVAGSATAAAGGSGWGGNGSAGGGGGIGSASSYSFSGGTGANQGGRGILDPFTDPLVLTFNRMGQPPIVGTSPYYSPDGVGGCSASSISSGNPATAGNGGFGGGGGSSNVAVGAGVSTAGNGGFGGGGGGAVAQTGGVASAGAGGYGGGGGKASGGSTNNQGAGGAGAVIILY